jgi:UPF0755 protein
VRLILAFLFACVVGVLVGGYVWVNRPFPLSQTLDLSIEPGQSAKDVASSVNELGVGVNSQQLYWWFRLSGESRKIKAGNYEIAPGTTPLSLLRKLVQGDEALRTVTLVEGWTFRQFRTALKKAENLKPESQDLSDNAIMQRLGKPGLHPEGRFFPDTYTYSKGSSDLAVLLRAMHAMEKKLEVAWANRNSLVSLQTPEQALILASIVEKETGRASDRPMISAVFNNRLRIGMRLQTDPTVIYGMGEEFKGNLRKVDLLTDTPWNTYTRAGLPPTPIAMPGKAALLAAVQPVQSNALYFVAKGDGSSQFSATLDDHNRAVNKYQRGQ